MIKHIVLWKLHDHADGHDKKENALRVKRALENMRGKVEGLLSLEFGINQLPADQAYDLSLLCEFTDWTALESYRVHPLHQSVIELLNKVRSHRVVIDYEI